MRPYQLKVFDTVGKLLAGVSFRARGDLEAVGRARTLPLPAGRAQLTRNGDEVLAFDVPAPPEDSARPLARSGSS